MIDWDDVRYFLAIARDGSVRAAAERLRVNHSTVLRRVAQLEKRLAARMFDRLPSGYRLTSAGEEVLALAAQMEASSNQLEARILGRDQSARGLLVPASLARDPSKARALPWTRSRRSLENPSAFNEVSKGEPLAGLGAEPQP